MKNISTLLRQRGALLRQARLANLALAYQTLCDVAARIARGQLRGPVTLAPVAPTDERFWPTLTALEGNQSVLDEHFADEDIFELADTLAFLAGNPAQEVTFRLEALEEQFLAPLREELAREGVALATAPVEQPKRT